MKQMGDSKPGTESCMTEADARKPNADFFSGNKNCRYDHFNMGGGKIDAAMRCTRDKLVQTMTMAGSYSPDRYDMSMTTRMEGGGPQAGTTMKMKVEARRVGDCDAKAKAAAGG